MFTVRPLPRNLPTPVPYPLEDLSSNMRYITTNAVNYIINDVNVMFVRLTSTQEKTIRLPIGVDGRLIIIQDLGGNSVENPCTIICSNCAFSDHATTKIMTAGPFTIGLKFNGSSYDIVGQRNEWNTEFLLLGDQPNIIPVSKDDTVVEGINGDMLIMMGNPTNKEVVISKPTLDPGETRYPEQMFMVIDSSGTAGVSPITVRFDDCTLNGNHSFVMTGANSWVSFYTLPDGNYQYLLSGGATFSGYYTEFSGKTFGFISVDKPFYNNATPGFSSTAGAVGGVFNTLGE